VNLMTETAAVTVETLNPALCLTKLERPEARSLKLESLKLEPEEALKPKPEEA
jgi:hypothetical protein